MRIWRYGAWIGVAAIASLLQVPSARAQTVDHQTDRERLIGAWHLEHIDSPGPNGKPSDIPQPKGMLIYTRDGHISVQLMYPQSASSLSNEYVRNGYEASFGSYTIDEKTHTLTHHVEGSITAICSSARTFRASMRSRRTAASLFTQPNPMSTGQSLGGITERTAKLKSRSAAD